MKIYVRDEKNDDLLIPLKIVTLKGQDGITPVKGQDYYTIEEKEELITEILQRIPNGNEVKY